ncbi:MAG: hypothetical protein L7F78_03910 [Syntrophales bacterium LBB04]|nr:hypothetical protein [Syntrophales bacterium LBB04]
MIKDSAISNRDEINSPLPMRPMGITFYKYKVPDNNPLEENMKKNLSLDQSWVEDCFLSPDDFRIKFRREKRRLERSSAPLSMALFQLNEPVLTNDFEIKRFLDCLRTKTRETDIKGWVDSETIGVILLDTNGAGLNSYIDLIKKQNGYCSLAVIKGTYPDSIFEKISDEAKAEPFR